MKKHLLAIIFSLIGWTTAFAQPVGDVERGKAKAATCLACHGPDGNSLVPAFPKIAGQVPKYFIEQMVAYKVGAEGPRPNPVMEQLVLELTDEDFADLAAYYRTTSVRSGTPNVQYEELGRQVYFGGNLEKDIPACAACHSADGLGNVLAGFPVLKGQHPIYTIQQLKAYRDGTRKTGEHHMMQIVAAEMSDDEIVAVAHYIGGLQ